MAAAYGDAIFADRAFAECAIDQICARDIHASELADIDDGTRLQPISERAQFRFQGGDGVDRPVAAQRQYGCGGVIVKLECGRCGH